MQYIPAPARRIRRPAVERCCESSPRAHNRWHNCLAHTRDGGGRNGQQALQQRQETSLVCTNEKRRDIINLFFIAGMNACVLTRSVYRTEFGMSIDDRDDDRGFRNDGGAARLDEVGRVRAAAPAETTVRLCSSRLLAAAVSWNAATATSAPAPLGVLERRLRLRVRGRGRRLPVRGGDRIELPVTSRTSACAHSASCSPWIRIIDKQYM